MSIDLSRVRRHFQKMSCRQTDKVFFRNTFLKSFVLLQVSSLPFRAIKNVIKSLKNDFVTDRPTDRRTDRPTKWLIESRSTRLKNRWATRVSIYSVAFASVNHSSFKFMLMAWFTFVTATSG